MVSTVLVCHNVTCRRQGAPQVWSALVAHVPSGITVEACGCLGQCGNGPMVLILPERIWYAQVTPQDGLAIAQQHLGQGRVVIAKQYQPLGKKIAPQRPWLAILGSLLLLTLAGFGIWLLYRWATGSS